MVEHGWPDTPGVPLPLGSRVRIAYPLDIFNLGYFPEGATGVVSWVNPDPKQTQPIAEVRLDQHFEALDEWDNVLQVCREDDGEVTWDCFVPA